jgi:hypothetical protein
MRKARLGFKIYSTDDELLVDEERDFDYVEKEKRWDSHQKAKARKLRCYNKNKEKYNAQRRVAASTISGRYKSAKIKAGKMGQEWEFTQEEWEDMWINAGWVSIPGTLSPSAPEGVRRPAYALRGGNRFSNTMMARSNLSGPWCTANCYIVFRGEPLSRSIYSANSPIGNSA